MKPIKPIAWRSRVCASKELEDSFNSWRANKRFVVGGELSTRQDLVANKERLKGLITGVKPVVDSPCGKGL